MHVILPFEKLFRKHNMAVNFVGHPLIDAISKENLKNKVFLKNTISQKNQLLLYYQEQKTRNKKNVKIMLSVVMIFLNIICYCRTKSEKCIL